MQMLYNVIILLLCSKLVQSQRAKFGAARHKTGVIWWDLNTMISELFPFELFRLQRQLKIVAPAFHAFYAPIYLHHGNICVPWLKTPFQKQSHSYTQTAFKPHPQHSVANLQPSKTNRGPFWPGWKSARAETPLLFSKWFFKTSLNN